MIGIYMRCLYTYMYVVSLSYEAVEGVCVDVSGGEGGEAVGQRPDHLHLHQRLSASSNSRDTQERRGTKRGLSDTP